MRKSMMAAAAMLLAWAAGPGSSVANPVNTGMPNPAREYH
jgi:hypothetical protein